MQHRKARFAGSSLCLAIGLLVLFLSPGRAQQQNEIVVTPLLSTTTTSAGQEIVLPEKDPQLVVTIFDIPPQMQLPEHKHPYPRYGYILSGNLRVIDTETGRSKTYRTGDFVVEAVGRWHSGANAGGESAKVLVIDIVEKGHTNTVLRQ
ncbi:cupin domain-containing protein [Bradyrhizobium sp. LA6.12]|uniref:cupin domain-containing protein n=1 Tax=unclassified Bradyrhizobium TaxID=2631580 RepID=UPI003399BAAB